MSDKKEKSPQEKVKYLQKKLTHGLQSGKAKISDLVTNLKDGKKGELSAEKLKQLQSLLMQKNGGKDIPPNVLAQLMAGGQRQPSKWSVKGMFMSVLQSMQGKVKLIDQFINLVTNKENDTANDVVQNARTPILFGTFVIFFFVILGLLWTATAPLDSAAVAIGTLITSSQKKTINHQDTGVIKKIYVDVGDSVKTSDKLIEFDDTRLRSEYENNLNQYRSFLSYESRLLAEVNGNEKITYPLFLLQDKDLPEVAKIIETQNNLFKSKNELQIAERDSLKQRIKQTQKQIDGYEAKSVALNKTLEVTQDRLEANKKLSEDDFVQKAVLLELESKEANVFGEIAINDTEIARAEQEVTKIEIDLINLDSKISTNNLSELKETQINLADRREKYFYYKDALSRVVIESPVDGVINALNYHTIGSTIHSGQPIMEISPSNDSLLIEAKLAPKLIDSITVGLKAKIRFSAFKSRTTPLFTGEVISLAPDIFIDQRMPTNDPNLAGGYYLVRIKIDMEEFQRFAEQRKLRLYPGMQAEVQIITGTRTLLRYLLDPVIDAMFKGFKEK